MSEIFISYASEDRPKAKAPAEVLTRQGWSVWWDTHILIGETFDRVIEKQIGAAIQGARLVDWNGEADGIEFTRLLEALNRIIGRGESLLQEPPAAEVERREHEKAEAGEQERITREKAKTEQRERERTEADERERKARERAEAQREQREKAAAAERERLEREKAEAERRTREAAESEREAREVDAIGRSPEPPTVEKERSRERVVTQGAKNLSASFFKRLKTEADFFDQAGRNHYAYLSQLITRDELSVWLTWILATALATAMGVAATGMGEFTDVVRMALMGAGLGTVVGISQWLVLRRNFKDLPGGN